MPPGTVGIEKWRREYNESIVGDLDKLMADIEERVAAMDREKEETKEAEEKVGPILQSFKAFTTFISDALPFTGVGFVLPK